MAPLPTDPACVCITPSSGSPLVALLDAVVAFSVFAFAAFALAVLALAFAVLALALAVPYSKTRLAVGPVKGSSGTLAD